MPTIDIQVADVDCGDDEDKFVKVPANWVICGTCEGAGKHSLHLGAITEGDRDRDWDSDSWEDYMSGGYDRSCDPCEGTGKVLVIDDAAVARSSDEVKAAVAQKRQQDRDDDEIDAMHRAEMAMGC